MFVTSLNNRGWDAVLVDPADKTTEVPEQLAGLVLIAPKDPIDGTIFLRDAFDISLNCSRSLAEHHSRSFARGSLRRCLYGAVRRNKLRLKIDDLKHMTGELKQIMPDWSCNSL